MAYVGISKAVDDDWWFCCHFVDLMDVRDPQGLREHMVLGFGRSLFEHPSLWSTAATYYHSCPVEGQAGLQAHLERVPLDSERKARKLIGLCKQFSVPPLHELHHVADDICKVMGK